MTFNLLLRFNWVEEKTRDRALWVGGGMKKLEVR